jgi:hypothetical protein
MSTCLLYLGGALHQLLNRTENLRAFGFHVRRTIRGIDDREQRFLSCMSPAMRLAVKVCQTGSFLNDCRARGEKSEKGEIKTVQSQWDSSVLYFV